MRAIWKHLHEIVQREDGERFVLHLKAARMVKILIGGCFGFRVEI
jgi:hypothetical protein